MNKTNKIAFSVGSVLLASVLVPTLIPQTFRVYHTFSLPVYFNGAKVKRYGVSHLHSQVFVSYSNHTCGSIFTGRSFVTVVDDNGEEKTYYSWKLYRTPNPERTRLTLRFE